MKYLSFTAGILSLLVLSACSPVTQGPQPTPESNTQTNTQTVQTTPTQESEEEEGLVSKVSPEGFRIYVDQQRGKYVLDGGKENLYVELPITASQGIHVEIFKETPYNVFIRTCPDGMGGYILYGQCPGEFYMVDRSSKKITNLSQKDLEVMAISSDESDAMRIAWADDNFSGNVEARHQIIIKNVEGHTVRTIKIDPQYFQYGDAHFSPDALKLVFAVAAGNPDKERGAVIVYDINSQTSKVIDTAEDGYFQIKGWKDNNTVDYNKV